MFKRLSIVMVLAGLVATPALYSSAASASTTARPVMTSTFLQPSVTTIGWSSQQFEREIALERAVGITGIIDQWTVDEDANQAYYPDSAGWYPRSTDMVDSLLYAAGQTGDTVWLGLANVSAWQSHAGDANWLNNQLYVYEQTANQLFRLYGTQRAFVGWYVPFEVSDQQLSADAGPLTSFFGSLAGYLHSHDGNKPVMTSPTYEHLTLSPAQYAASVKSVLGSLDVINVQDTGGAGYEKPSDITNWFTALHNALAGTRSAVWDDPDMYSAANNGGPMSPTQLQADLAATAGLATAWSGFSFTTQMDPAVVGTSTYYNAYQAWYGQHALSTGLTSRDKAAAAAAALSCYGTTDRERASDMSPDEFTVCGLGV